MGKQKRISLNQFLMTERNLRLSDYKLLTTIKRNVKKNFVAILIVN